MKFGFVGPTYQHPLSTVNAELCMNWVPEVTSGGQAKAPLVYVTRPGLATFAAAGTGPRRASLKQNGRAFVVSGGSFREVFSDGTTTEWGTVSNGSRPASMAANGDQGDQVIIISNGLGYTFTLSTNTFSAIADPQFPANALMVAYVDGYFIVIVEDSTGADPAASYDGTSWAAADVGEKSKTTDYLMAVIIDQDEGKAWFIGTDKTEVWSNEGSAGFPLEPIDLIIPYGTGSTFSWTNLGGSIYGVGQSEDGGRVVVRYQGYQYQRISHHAMEAAIQAYSEAAIANLQGFGFEWRGHRFYLLTSIEEQETWVYDEATDLWTHWDYWDTDTASSKAFLGVGHLFVFGKHLVGSHQDGTIYELSADYLDDDGDAIRRVRRAPYVHAEGKRIVHAQLTLGFQMGVGLVSGQGSAPVALVRWSDDQAHTWSAERSVSLGALGAYGARAVLRRLGMSGFHGRVYEVVVTDPVVNGLVDAELELGRAA